MLVVHPLESTWDRLKIMTQSLSTVEIFLVIPINFRDWRGTCTCTNSLLYEHIMVHYILALCPKQGTWNCYTKLVVWGLGNYIWGLFIFLSISSSFTLLCYFLYWCSQGSCLITYTDSMGCLTCYFLFWCSQGSYPITYTDSMDCIRFGHWNMLQ